MLQHTQQRMPKCFPHPKARTHAPSKLSQLAFSTQLIPNCNTAFLQWQAEKWRLKQVKHTHATEHAAAANGATPALQQKHSTIPPRTCHSWLCVRSYNISRTHHPCSGKLPDGSSVCTRIPWLTQQRCTRATLLQQFKPEHMHQVNCHRCLSAQSYNRFGTNDNCKGMLTGGDLSSALTCMLQRVQQR
jgi:hypothetical protein